MGWRERRARSRPARGGEAGYWLRHPALSLAGCALAAGFLALIAAVTADETSRLNKHGVRAQAVLLEVDEHSDYVIVRYRTTEGRSIDATLYDYSWDPAPKVGDTPAVIYDPQAPETLVQDARLAGDFGSSWVAGGLAVALLAGCGWLIKTWPASLFSAQQWRAGRG
jgi:hypothetical protein